MTELYMVKFETKHPIIILIVITRKVRARNALSEPAGFAKRGAANSFRCFAKQRVWSCNVLRCHTPLGVSELLTHR